MAEKLFVLLFAILLVGGAAMVFGPVLAEKFEFVNALLGGGSKTPTLADPVVAEETSNAMVYVLFAMAASAFFAFFVTPLLFPRARSARQRVLVELADRWPILTPLINPDALADENMEDLRALAREAKRFEAHKSQALEIVPTDFGRQADPMDITIDHDDSSVPVLEHLTGRQAAAQAAAFRGIDPEATVAAVARDVQSPSSRIHGDDEIPFDAVSPSVKPQMEPLQPRRPSRPDFPRIGAADDSATVNAAASSSGDGFVARVLRESGNFPLVIESGDSAETTAVRDEAGFSTQSAEAPTVSRDALTRQIDDTAPEPSRRPYDPDATTGQDWDVPK